MSGTSNTQLKKDIDELKIKVGSHEQYQEKMLMKLTGIENLLAGTEYDQNNGGGLVKKVNRNKKCISDLIIWQEKTKTRNGIIYIVVTAIAGFLGTIIITNYNKIFIR